MNNRVVLINSFCDKQNKIDAIYYTTYLLKNVYKNDEILTIINSHKKKDDLCDAFLMCVYYHIQLHK